LSCKFTINHHIRHMFCTIINSYFVLRTSYIGDILNINTCQATKAMQISSMLPGGFGLEMA